MWTRAVRILLAPFADFSNSPSSMIDAIAGPYGRNFSQGPVGGILGKMGYTSDEVYKL